MFSVQGSGNFQGTAKLSNATGQSINSNQIPLQWVKRGNIPFQATRHLFNPLNENRRVQSSRDGQVGILCFFSTRLLTRECPLIFICLVGIGGQCRCGFVQPLGQTLP